VVRAPLNREYSDIKKPVIADRLFYLNRLLLDYSSQNLVKILCLFVIYRNYKTTPAFEWNSKDDKTAWLALGFHWTIAGAWLHCCHLELLELLASVPNFYYPTVLCIGKPKPLLTYGEFISIG
jgi:hypothetical protein